MSKQAAPAVPSRREFHAAVALLAAAPLTALAADDKPPADPVAALADGLIAAAKAPTGRT